MIKRAFHYAKQLSKVFCIPKKTLYNKVNGRPEIGSRNGPWTVLTKAEGDMIADWAFNMTRRVFGRTRSEILDTVQCIIKQDGRAFPFVNCRPGKDKYHAFLKRHPKLYT